MKTQYSCRGIWFFFFLFCANFTPFSNAQQCESLVTSQLSSIQYECVDGCVVISNQSKIYLESLTFINVDQYISTCISFNSIEDLHIESLILTNIQLDIPTQNSAFISILNTKNVQISDLAISYVEVKRTDQSVIDFQIFSISTSVDSTSIDSMRLLGDQPQKNVSTSNISLIQILSSIVSIQKIIHLGFTEKALISSNNSIVINEIQIDYVNQKYILSDLITSPLSLESKNTISIQTVKVILSQGSSTQQILSNIQVIDKPNNQFQSPQLIVSVILGKEGLIPMIYSLTAFVQSSTNSSTAQKEQEDQPIIQINEIRTEIGQTQEISSYKSISMNIQFQYSESISIDKIFASMYKWILMYYQQISKVSINQIQLNNPNQGQQIILRHRMLQVMNVPNFEIGVIQVSNILITEDSVIFVMYFIGNLVVNSMQISNSNFDQANFYDLYKIDNVTLNNIDLRNILLMPSTYQNVIQPLFSFKGCGTVIIDTLLLRNQSNDSSDRILSVHYKQKYRETSNRLILATTTKEVQFRSIDADLSPLLIGFFEGQDGLRKAFISNSSFSNCFAPLSGGCFNFRSVSQQSNTILEPSLQITDSTFTQSKSWYFGGAISGYLITLVLNTKFSFCSSLIGGAIYSTSAIRDQILTNIAFEGNSAELVDPDVSFGVQAVRKSNVYEFNPNLQNTPMYLNPLGQYTDEMQFYAGILYVYQIKLKINDEWYSNLPTFSQNGNQINTNLYQFSKSLTYIQNEQIDDISYFYLLYDPMGTSDQDYPELVVSFTFSESQNQVILNYQSDQPCANYMETINLSNGYNQICAYCGFTKAFNELTNTCESCDTNYFSLCYVNQTFLRTGYWRQNYTMNTTQIETCTIASQSCNGGNGTGNSLCYTGHIGAQCLNCDIRGEYWGESYSMSGLFSCNKCSEIDSNNLKIFSGYVLILLSLLLIIKGNFKATKNQIYAIYLARIRMIYIGSSLNRMQQTSTLVKILLFNVFFTNLANSFVKLRVWTSIQEVTVVFSQPLMSEFFSLDCFLVKQLTNNINIGFANLVISVAMPGSILLVLLILSIITVVVKPKEIRTVVTTLPLSFTYLYLIAFLPFILELCLKSMHCIRLVGDQNFSLIDLSLECDDLISSELITIRLLAIPILIIFVFLVPITILLILVSQRTKLQTICMKLTLGFLYQEYKDQFYLWEFVRILLKSICVFLQVALLGNPRLYGSLITISLVGYLVVLGVFRPFKGKQFSRLEQVSILIQILQIQSAVQYQGYESESTQTTHFQDVILVKVIFIFSQILNIIFIVWIGILILIAFFQKHLLKLVQKHKIIWLQKYLPIYSQRLRQNMKTFRNLVHKLQSRKNTLQDEEFQPILNSEGDNPRYSNLEEQSFESSFDQS